jgi:hypothetical protein
MLPIEKAVRQSVSALCLLAFTFTSPLIGHAVTFSQNDRQQAEALWEAAVAAKGGRERLHKVESLVVSYDETVRNFLGVVVHRGLIEELYVFPDKYWGWNDGLPPPFRLTVTMLNVEREQRCVARQGSDKALCSSPKQSGPSPPNERISEAQYLYLMETRWVRPVPYSVTKDRIGSRSLDVLHTRFENKRIDYYLDRKTHLAQRVAVFYGNRERETFKIDLSEYENMGGIQMPRKQKNGKISFELNPMFDEEVFTRPPSIGRGPQAWRKLEN